MRVGILALLRDAAEVCQSSLLSPLRQGNQTHAQLFLHHHSAALTPDTRARLRNKAPSTGLFPLTQLSLMPVPSRPVIPAFARCRAVGQGCSSRPAVTVQGVHSRCWSRWPGWSSDSGAVCVRVPAWLRSQPSSHAFTHSRFSISGARPQGSSASEGRQGASPHRGWRHGSCGGPALPGPAGN